VVILARRPGTDQVDTIDVPLDDKRRIAATVLDVAGALRDGPA
jgi:hypothetical protein